MNDNSTTNITAEAHATQLILKLFENSKENVEEIVDDLPMVYAVVTVDGEIVRANRDMGDLFEVPFEDLIGQPFRAIFNPDDWVKFRQALRTTAEVGGKQELRLIAHQQENELYYTWTLARLDRVSTRVLIAVIGQDNTKSELNLQKVNRLMQLFDRLVRASQVMMDGRSMEEALTVAVQTALDELAPVGVKGAEFKFILPNRSTPLLSASGKANGLSLDVQWEDKVVGQVTIDQSSLENPELLTFVKLLGQSTYLVVSHLSFQKEMEEKVRLGTAEIAELNTGLNSLLNSLNEGYCVFDLDGVCLPISSRRMREFYGSDPTGKHLTEVLKVSEEARTMLFDWLTLVKNGWLPFEELSPLCPVKWWYPTGEALKIETIFHPVRNEEGRTVRLAMVATDRSKELQAQQDAEAEKEKSYMILRIVENLPGFFDCWTAISTFHRDFFDRVLDEENTTRFAHSLKSSFKFFGWDDMAANLNNFEKAFPDSSTEELQTWHTKFGALLQEFRDKFPQLMDFVFKANKQMNTALQEDFVFDLLKSSPDLESLRKKLAANYLFSSVKELLEPLILRLEHRAKEAGVPVTVNFNDQGERIYARAYRGFFAALEHLFNNIVDHGFARFHDDGLSGKVDIEITSESAGLILVISDNGQGIDKDRVMQKAWALGITPTPEQNKNPLRLIFMPKLSTVENASERAGRGVGMEVVAFELRKINGSIDVESTLGQGTKFTIRLPRIEPELS